MTTGSYAKNVIIDGPYPTGTFYQKSWSGADRPSYKRAYYRRGIYYPSVGAPPVRVRAAYRKPLPSVKDAPHSWSTHFSEQSRQVGIVRDPNPRTVSSLSNWSIEYSFPVWEANDSLVLVNRLRSRVQGSSFDLGVFLGTSHQSLRLITEAATRLYKGYKLAKRGNFIGAANQLFGETTAQAIKGRRKARLLALQDEYRALSSVSPAPSGAEVPFSRGQSKRHRARLSRKIKAQKALTRRRVLPADIERSLPYHRKERRPKHVVAAGWLELQYGWKPLLEDLKGGAEALAESTLPKRTRYFASIKKSSSAKVIMRNNNVGSFILHPKRSLIEIGVRVIAYVEEKNVPTMQDLISPATIAWELLPWSFVADWALPIGDYLSARGFASEMSGTYVVTERKLAVAANFSGSLGIASYEFPSNYYKQYLFSRSVSNTLPVPYPNVKGFGESFSWKRAANAVSLFIQSVK